MEKPLNGERRGHEGGGDPLDAAADMVVTAAQLWRARRGSWSETDRRLEQLLWVELLDLQDSRRRQDADDVVFAALRLMRAAEIHATPLASSTTLDLAVRSLRTRLPVSA
jgi:hypothetical protein